MKSWGGLLFALLLMLSNDAKLILAQYVTTVTVSINDNPFCTGIGAFGGNFSTSPTSSISGPGISGTYSGISGFGSSNGSSSGTTSTASSTTISSPSVGPTDTAIGPYDALGYYPAPPDGDLLGGPVFTRPGMTLELCGTLCQGYSYLALENGDECNCGSSAPNGPPSSALPFKLKRRSAGSDCIPCAGNSAECCGAPGGYALVYHIMPEAEGSSIIGHKPTSSSSPVTEASSTFYSPISPGSIVASTSTSSDGYVTASSSTSYVAVAPASTPVYSSTYSAPYSNSTFSSPAIISITNTLGSNSSAGASATAMANGTTTATNSGTSGTNGTAANGGNSTTNGTVANSDNSGAPQMVGNGGKSGSRGGGSGTATSNGSATATVPSHTAEPTAASPTPSCVSSANYVGNNTKYIDYFGYTYDIRCNLNLQSMPADSDAHADSFEDCLEYCSLLTDCVAVTYQDPPSIPDKSSNCHPKWNFEGYAPSSVDGTYSAVNVNGASPGTIENQDLCTANNIQGVSYSNSTYYDDYGSAWIIGCDTTLAITSSAALSATITDTLASCVDYCSIYSSCDMVNWTGPHTNGTTNNPNCFPASSNSTAGPAKSAPGSGYAILNLS